MIASAVQDPIQRILVLIIMWYWERWDKMHQFKLEDTLAQAAAQFSYFSYRYWRTLVDCGNVSIVDTNVQTINKVNRRYSRNQTDIATPAILIEINEFIGIRAILLRRVRIVQMNVLGSVATVMRSIQKSLLARNIPQEQLVLEVITALSPVYKNINESNYRKCKLT